MVNYKCINEQQTRVDGLIALLLRKRQKVQKTTFLRNKKYPRVYAVSEKESEFKKVPLFACRSSNQIKNCCKPFRECSKRSTAVAKTTSASIRSKKSTRTFANKWPNN